MRDRNNAIWTILAVRPEATDEHIGRLLTKANIPWESKDLRWSRDNFEKRVPGFITAVAPVVAAMLDDGESADEWHRYAAAALTGLLASSSISAVAISEASDPKATKHLKTILHAAEIVAQMMVTRPAVTNGSAERARPRT